MPTTNIAIIGASGAIGNALIKSLARQKTATLYAFSRQVVNFSQDNIHSGIIDYDDEGSIKNAAALAANKVSLDYVIVATGLLHDQNCKPEKTFKDISMENLTTIFKANTFGPAIIAKHFLPKLNKQTRSVFAVLSARVGSITDNRMGGWYTYRASKTALNMIIKTAAIETARINPNAVIVGLHPGTVDSALSKPFQTNVPKKQLFTPSYSAEKLIQVMSRLNTSDTGHIFAWDGKKIAP